MVLDTAALKMLFRHASFSTLVGVFFAVLFQWCS